MAVNVLARRELYVDVVMKEEQLDEIFLYQVDFLKDGSFRSTEYVYHTEEKQETEQTGEEHAEETEEQEEPVDIRELFKEEWERLLDTEVTVDIFATDAGIVMERLFLELLKKYPELPMRPAKGTKKEVLHDLISMGRVVSMSAFDEEQYLSAGIRRRMKEKYHEQVDEVKRERNAHVFMRRMAAGSPYELELFITDSEYRIRKNVLLPKTSNEETLALKLAEVLKQYPEADLITDRISITLYRLFCNMKQFLSTAVVPAVFSLESMFCATGKTVPTKELVENYLLYIRNLEDIRFGRFVSDTVYSEHRFYLPVRISGEKDWKKQFKENTVWKPAGKDAYCMQCDADIKGKYMIKAGREQFVLKIKQISLVKYLGQYAVLCLEAENHCYPGMMDRERIEFLASHLFSGEQPGGPDSIELKMKVGGQAYSLSTVRLRGNEEELWLNGLLALGRKKAGKKHNLTLLPLTESMYCTESGETEIEKEIIRVAVLRNGCMMELEQTLARCCAPDKKKSFGKLSKKQKKQIRSLFAKYRYLTVSFGYEYQGGRKAECTVYSEAEQKIGIRAVTERLREKFSMFFG